MSDVVPLFKVDLDAISSLDYACAAWTSGPRGHAGGVIRFFGRYRTGSAGSGDARFIKWKIGEFCDLERPRIEGLVIDFRELVYEWGDDLSVITARRLIAGKQPVLVVVSPDSAAAFGGILGGQSIRTDADDAIREVDSFLRTFR